MKQIIVDEDGKWFTSTGTAFHFTDPVSGTVFEPGVRTKIKPNWWVEMQGVFLIPDPDPAPEAAPAATLVPDKEPDKAPVKAPAK